jgi:hypothetical protein
MLLLLLLLFLIKKFQAIRGSQLPYMSMCLKVVEFLQVGNEGYHTHLMWKRCVSIAICILVTNLKCSRETNQM